MEYLYIVIIFCLGSAIGSFISVISVRYNTGLSFFKGRSFCFSCNFELKGRDLVPLFSYLFLRGSCRYCKSRIPKETFITEILMGGLTLVAYFMAQNFLFFLLLVFIFGSILLITVYDFKHSIIPDSFLGLLFLFSFIYLLILTPHAMFIILSLVAGLLISIPFALIFFLSHGAWIGFGDVKYIFVIGFFLGFSVGLSAVILSFWIGAIFAILLLFLQRLKLRLPFIKNNLTIRSEVPFGPFLSVGFVVSFLLSLDLFHINELLQFFN